MSSTTARTKACPYILSQICPIIMTALVAAICLMIPTKYIVPEFETLPPPINFDRDSEPILFGHLSDVHISEFKSHSIPNYEKIMKFFFKIHPMKIFNTGDIQDSMVGNNTYYVCHYHQWNWDTYTGILESFTPEQRALLLDIPGNHDGYDVATFNSPHNQFFVDIDPIEDHYYVNRTDDGQFTYITLFDEPFPHSKDIMDFWGQPNEHVLNLLEDALKDVPEGNQIIMLSHFPPTMHVPNGARSRNGKSIDDLMDKAHVYLAGHTHTKVSHISNKPRFLAFTVSDMITHKNAAIMSFDNGHYAFNTFKITKTPTFVVTNPPPITQMARSLPGIGSHEPIRAVAFKNQSLFVTGDVIGEMKCTKKKNYVCELDMGDLSPGEHTIFVNGTQIDFIIGTTVKAHEEEKVTFLENPYIALTAFFALAAIILFVYIPFPICEADENSYLWATIGSPVIWKQRISRFPRGIRILLGIFAAWPLALPSLFYEVDGRLGFIWTYGYVVGSKTGHSQWGFIFTMVYGAGVMCPVTIAAMALLASWPLRWYNILDLAIIIGFTYIEVIMMESIIRTVDWAWAMTSPLFIFAPIIMYVALITWRVKASREVEVSDYILMN